MLKFLNALHLYYQFTIGIIPNSTFVYYPAQFYTDNPVQLESINQIEITTPEEYFFVGGSFEAYFMTQHKKKTFNTYQTSFNFNTGFRFGKIEIGYNHLCTHPLAMVANDKALPNSIYGSFDEIYVKIGNFK